MEQLVRGTPGAVPGRRRVGAVRRARPAAVVTLSAVVLLTGCATTSRGTAAPSSSPGPTTPGPATSSPAHPTRSPTSSPSPSAGAGNPRGMSDAQLVGQLFVTYVYGSGPDTVTPAQRAANLTLYGEPTPADVVRRWHLGGVILLDHNTLDPARPDLSTGNLAGAEQLRALTSGLQAVARADSGVPLLIATDQEGGTVQRIPFVPSRPSQWALAAESTAAITCSYARLGQELLALGVNEDYAPVADVARSTSGVIGTRSFGSNPSADARDVVAAVDGLQSSGVLATLKHWPGHGATSQDSHVTLPVLTESASQWRAVDRVPFAAAAQSAAAIMVGHLAFPALDPTGTPASLSARLDRDQLRAGLGFTGLVVTDSLWMQPARQAGTPGAVAIQALNAGADMLLMSPDVPAASAAVLQHMHEQPAFRSLVRAAVGRILAAKSRVGIIRHTGCG